MSTRMMVAALVLFLGPMAWTASAAASESVQPVADAIATQDRTIGQAPGYLVIEHLSSYPKSQYPTIAPEIAALRRTIDRAASAVTVSSVTSVIQKTARADWVYGAQMTAKAMTHLAAELTDLAVNKMQPASEQARLAKTLFTSGRKLTQKADSLLGLPLSL